MRRSQRDPLIAADDQSPFVLVPVIRHGRGVDESVYDKYRGSDDEDDSQDDSQDSEGDFEDDSEADAAEPAADAPADATAAKMYVVCAG